MSEAPITQSGIIYTDEHGKLRFVPGKESTTGTLAEERVSDATLERIRGMQDELRRRSSARNQSA